jgi:glutathione S-transferase
VRKEVFVPAVNKYFPLYEKLLAQSGSGFMLPSGFSYVDLLVAQIIDWLAKMEPEVIAKHPKASQFMAKVLALPQLKEYMAKRKV